MEIGMKEKMGVADKMTLLVLRSGCIAVTVFDTEEKQLCLGKSKAQLPARLAKLCFTPGKVAFLLCQRL